MCNLAAVGVGMSAVGMVQGAQQQRQQGKYQKGVSEYNARVEENEAEKVRGAGVREENAQRERVAELISRQRAQLAAGNISVTSQSAEDLREDTLALGEVDALRIRSNYLDRADTLDTRAALTRSGGAFTEAAGESSARGSLLAGTGQLITQGVAAKWFTPSSSANTHQVDTVGRVGGNSA